MFSFTRHLPGIAALALSATALAISLGMFHPKTAQDALSSNIFTPIQTVEIGKLSRDYLLQNPETIRDAIQALKAKEAAEAIIQHKDDIFADADAPVIGNPMGDVILVQFFDYKCPYCKQVSPALEGLLREDPKLKIVFKEFPILDDSSVLAARAALAAQKQGKYLAFHQALMAHRGELDLNSIAEIAATIGLNDEQLVADMKSQEIQKQLSANHALALSLGIRSTPTFIVGDKVMSGALSIKELQSLIADTRKGF